MVEVDTFVLDEKLNHFSKDLILEKPEGLCEEEQTEFGALGVFLTELRSKDRTKRDKTLDNACICVEKWAMALEDPILQRSSSLYLPVLVRLVNDCPFSEVRLRLTNFLERLKNRNVRIPSPSYDSPSTFIAAEEVVSVSRMLKNMEQDIQEKSFVLFERAFTMECRVSHLIKLMGYHPKYLSVFLEAHQLLMLGDGPLPRHLRVYIAILAASRYKCGYLVSILELEFHSCGGDVRWLTGIGNIPGKLHNLLKLNRFMAHQPWTVGADHVKELLVGQDSWSIAELTQAVVILAHYHSLAGFALGCGLTPEIDTPCGHVWAGSEEGAPNILSNPALCLAPESIETSVSEGSTPGGGSFISTPLTPPLPNVASKKVEHFIQGVHGDHGKLCDMLKTVDSESDEESLEQKDKDYAESVSGWTLGSEAVDMCSGTRQSLLVCHVTCCSTTWASLQVMVKFQLPFPFPV
jgi:sestrin